LLIVPKASPLGWDILGFQPISAIFIAPQIRFNRFFYILAVFPVVGFLKFDNKKSGLTLSRGNRIKSL